MGPPSPKFQKSDSHRPNLAPIHCAGVVIRMCRIYGHRRNHTTHFWPFSPLRQSLVHYRAPRAPSDDAPSGKILL